MNIIYLVRNFLQNVWRKIFHKEVVVTRHVFIAPAYDRGKEDKHTKMRRKMSTRSRRINFLHDNRK